MRLIILLSIGLLMSLWSVVVVTDELPTCRSDDFKYSFTECDESGGRWRVSVPKSPYTCTGGAPNAATRVRKCYTSCDFGEFFNSTSLSCHPCAPGYYSLGGGIRITASNSTSLPSGFHINTATINTSSHCSGWKVISNYFESQSNNSNDGCVSKISYAVRIVKKGKLSFKYQYSIPEDLLNAIIFNFQYHNYDDTDGQSLDSGPNNRFPSVTNEQQKWKEIQINLQNPGLYVFDWKSVLIGRSTSYFPNTVGIRSSLFGGRSGSHSGSGFIRIKDIFVDGVAFASECTPCESGTYSDKSGAKKCIPCPMNTQFSGTGAVKCVDCDSINTYAPKGSEKCLERPLCGHNDYYNIESECDLSSRRQRVDYKWIEPKICLDMNKIKPESEYRFCNETIDSHKRLDSCNLGQELRDDGLCHFCDVNQYRDKTIRKCESCPPSTSPMYALSYKIWHSGRTDDHSLPEFMTTECAKTDDVYEYDCDPQIAWMSNPYHRDYIRTGPATELGSYLFLTLTLPGFRQQNGGEIIFNFEIDCDSKDYCLFLFMEIKRNAKLSQQTNIVKEWNQQSIGIQSYRHRIEQNVSLALSWVFQRNYSFQSNAKIYEITVTNPLVGSAIKCNPCPHSNQEYCIPCPFGQYFETYESNKTENIHQIEAIRSRNRLTTKLGQNCKQCPENTYINDSLSFPIGANKSCIKCGPSLRDHKGIECYSDCRVNIDNDSFDLRQLKQPLIHSGGQLFTSGGTKYYHLFNITLCGRPDFRANCVDNMTVESTDSTEEYGIRSMICRSTIIPDREQTFATQAVSLGDQLIGITRSTTYQNITVHPEFQTTASDLHFYYSTPVPTAACPDGRRLTLTLRCAPTLEQNLSISTPNACPDGTCDGCTFHLLVKTKTAAACRLCRTSDYETVVGECIEGQQQIHFVNPKGCIISMDGNNRVKTRHCSIIPRQVQIGIALVSGVGVVLLVLVFHFWKKNRNLEYKYCKLIEGNDKSAECCAEDEDEDEDNEDQVVICPKKPKEVYEEGYETIQLTKHNDRNRDII